MRWCDDRVESKRYATKEDTALLIAAAMEAASTPSTEDDTSLLAAIKRWGAGAKNALDKLDKKIGFKQ